MLVDVPQNGHLTDSVPIASGRLHRRLVGLHCLDDVRGKQLPDYRQLPTLAHGRLRVELSRWRRDRKHQV